ncbi:hypothetical protein PpBr36_04987 [Pyricularia pennisetigena]|uniref:hypothetical protein n=1 Tax=Pyricularia pennisetigena TaxID=1578925 RepID=UPI0011546C1B|nr:hypothetical protein PpBr36_04987 [Pyricularia pennisetigena]TLS27431.1 hypothetical protein PpBr36_04987 [Pyricularia pennisetigena]
MPRQCKGAVVSRPFGGLPTGAQAHVALPTSLPAFRSIWSHGDIPGGPVPSTLQADVFTGNRSTNTWSFTTLIIVVGATTSSGAPASSRNSLGLKYASETRFSPMDYMGGKPARDLS